MKTNLLSPATLNNISIKNRVIMAPLTRSRANNPDLAPTDIHAKYYKQRSSAGLIISEGVVVSPEATGYINVPGIYTDTQVLPVSSSTKIPALSCCIGFSLTPIFSTGILNDMASITSNRNLVLFSILPPYWSVLLLLHLLKNW